MITNHHVIAECVDGVTQQVAVQQGDEKPAAKMSDYDDVNDLALVFVDKQLQPLTAANAPAVGDAVVAIGSPYGMSGTTTSGTITNIQDGLYTTDAADRARQLRRSAGQPQRRGHRHHHRQAGRLRGAEPRGQDERDVPATAELPVAARVRPARGGPTVEARKVIP